MKLTSEQRQIIKTLKQGSNVRVTAVAGSGKTTSILGLVGAQKNILVLCYNNRLRQETQNRVEARIKKLRLNNDDFDEDEYCFHVHTFHSFCYGILEEPLAATDLGIIKLVGKCIKNKSYFADKYSENITEYDIIVCDEAQDLNETYYMFLSVLLKHTKAKLCLIGDPRQAIYQFNGANEKYLLDAPRYFAREFVDLTLSETFRLTKPISKFINAMYADDATVPQIVSNKPSDLKPLIMHRAVNIKQIADFIGACEPGEVLVLMYSTKRQPYKTSVRLANYLNEMNVPISFGVAPEEDDKNKVLMLSYHQSKGLERPIVILLDLNVFYFEITGEDPTKLPNLWYVAMSRASEYLLVHSEASFKFINAGLTALGSNVKTSDTVSIEDLNGGIKRNKKMSFEDYVKYTPSSELWEQIQHGPKLPKMHKSALIKKQLCITQGSILSSMVVDYLRRSDRQQSASVFAQKYIDQHRGGLKSNINIGVAWYDGYDSLNTETALQTCERTLVTLLKELGLSTRDIITHTTRVGSTELVVAGKIVFITIEPYCLETRIRWSAAKKDDVLIDIIGNSYGVAVVTQNNDESD